MDDLNDLRAARKKAADDMTAKAAALQAVEDQDGATDDAVAGATAAFETAQKHFAKLDGQVKRAEAAEAAQLAAVAPEAGSGTSDDASPRVAAMAKEPGLRFGATLRVMAAAGGDGDRAIRIAEAQGMSGLIASQNVSQGVKGGIFVPEDVGDEVIELLRPKSVVMGLPGVRFIPMPNGNFTQNRRASGASFGYGEENDDIAVTGYEYGQVKLSAKKLSGIIPISNDLIGMASTAMDRMVRDDALDDAAAAADLNFLRAAGTDSAPKGLRWQLLGTTAAATNILTMTAAPDLQKVDDDLGRLELALMNANVDATGAHWIMSPRVAMYLTNLRDGNGNKVYPEMSDGRLRRKPVHVTTNVPDNLGVGGNESEIMLVAPRHIMIGETGGMNVAMSSEASYRDSNGNLQSAFSKDETLLRLIMQHDIGLRHLLAVAVLTGVTWGAV
ncbi:phage major capsid protein [Ponticoccus alexandrii]|uniref:Phage major capsid protein n=1 Tax=Ponticoccus alexandrii TaxID=1943633 RepID=A0ABX7F8D1_9RHOB|nr:phage major capsid protein [Ponticoccus alexandrii]ETA53976.1 phage capsid protein [Rhodobacteraceae bacterium PD-2]QRF66374.1 phage major capsid protein [Ponticoccus alexandrii]